MILFPFFLHDTKREKERKTVVNAEGIKTSKLAQSKACNFYFTLKET